VYSSALWLMPPTLGTKIIAVGQLEANIENTLTVSNNLEHIFTVPVARTSTRERHF
jgi:hypothetical protein